MSTDVFRAVVIADSIARCYGGALDDARLHIAAPDYASAKAIALAMVEGLGATESRHHRWDISGDGYASNGGSFQVFDRRAFALAIVAYHGPAESRMDPDAGCDGARRRRMTSAGGAL